MPQTLSISHNIFLTRDQRYDLNNKKTVTVVGVSLPVWFHGEKTSEPGKEVFCKYRISSHKHVYKNIRPYEQGYEIFLSDEYEEKDLIPLKIKKFFYKSNTNVACCKSLLDISDRGSEWLYFRAYDRKYFNIIHSVEIQKIENLLESLVV